VQAPAPLHGAAAFTRAGTPRSEWPRSDREAMQATRRSISGHLQVTHAAGGAGHADRTFPVRRAQVHPRPGVECPDLHARQAPPDRQDRKSTRLNSSHVKYPYAVFSFNKKAVHADAILSAHEGVPLEGG